MLEIIIFYWSSGGKKNKTSLGLAVGYPSLAEFLIELHPSDCQPGRLGLTNVQTTVETEKGASRRVPRDLVQWPRQKSGLAGPVVQYVHVWVKTRPVKGDAQVSGSDNAGPFTDRVRSQEEGGAGLQCRSWVRMET